MSCENKENYTYSDLHCGVVRVLVADEEGALDGASVGVDEVVPEDLLVDVDVVHVDGAVEGQGDHLGDLQGGRKGNETTTNGDVIFKWNKL